MVLEYNEQTVNELVLSGNFELDTIEEERGVGASKDYLAAIREIVLYCEQYIKQNFNRKDADNSWKIDIPENLTKPFDIFTRLDIEVTVIDNPKLAKSATGSGDIPSFESPRRIISNWDKKIKDVKPTYVGTLPDDFENKTITLEATTYSDGTKLNKGMLFKTLIHEINHKIDEYSRATNKNNSEETARGVFRQTGAYLHLKKYLKGKYLPIYYIIYNLFSESERNATVAGIYGELEGMNSVRENFIRDLKETQTYGEYEFYKKIVNDFEKISFEKYYELWEYLTVFFDNPVNRILSPLPKDNHVTPKKMRQAFLDKAKKSLEKMYKGFGKVASYYYDMQEKTRPFGRYVKHVDENVDLSELRKLLENVGIY